MVAAQRDDLRLRLAGKLVAQEIDHLRGVHAAIHVVAEEDERVLLVERRQLSDHAHERVEVSVDVADRKRSVRH